MITTVLDGFKQLAPEGCEVVYSRGANIVDLVPDPEGEFYPDGQPRPRSAFPPRLIAHCLAKPWKTHVKATDRGRGGRCDPGHWRRPPTATLELLGGQNALIDALSNVARETGKPFVVVLVSSKPQVLPASVIGTNGVIVDETPAEGTSALLWAPSPGMKGGQAIAEIILGETEPSGRLPITFPRHAGQLPVYYNQILEASTATVTPTHAESGIRIRRGSEIPRSNTEIRPSPMFRNPAYSPKPTPCMPKSPSPIRAIARARK